ncbi:MAG TPA: family 16 glycosylhydrolase, partial [Polyangiaceae bacterium]
MRGVGLSALVLAASVAVPRLAGAVASAELYRTQAYVYGRFDARIRYAAGDGVISSFFLWKEGSEAANAYWNELDFEKLGADCHMQTNAIYGNPEAEHHQTDAMPGDICSGYHDYRFEWTPDYIAWSVDGKEFRRETGATATA